MSAVIALIASVGLFAGLISVVVPLTFLHIYNRRIALLIIVGSVIVFQAAASSPPDTAPMEAAKQVVQTRQPISDGCDLAGAIPNCKEEVARMAAEEAAHPLPPLAKSTPGRDHPNRYISEALSAMQADENSRKAAEARAGVAALERRRRLDELDFDVARSRAALRNSIEEGKAQMRRDQLDVERAQYGLRIEQRNLDRVLRQH